MKNSSDTIGNRNRDVAVLNTSVIHECAPCAAIITYNFTSLQTSSLF